MGFNLVEQSHTVKVIDKAFDGSDESMIASYNALEDVFDGFLGGIEVDYSKLDNLVPASVIERRDEEGELIKKAWKDEFPIVVSLDKTKAIIRMCTPLSLTAWNGMKNEMFYKMTDYFGIENVMTRSKNQDLISSDAYTEKVEM
ncbi:MAG: hypothetical protein ACTSP4_00910 [Candidatus Hodarchaeales archaeon]